MSTNEHPRTATGRSADLSAASENEARSGLREDLEAVWAISASDGSGAGVDAVLAFAGAALQRAAMLDIKVPGDEAAEVARLVSEIVDIADHAARRALFRHETRRLAPPSLTQRAGPRAPAATRRHRLQRSFACS